MSINKEDVDKVVISFCKEIIKEPLYHFSEYDLHALLVEKLYDDIKVLKRKKYDTSVHRGKNSKTFYKTRLVHREYGCGGKRRIDIVIFDEKDVKKINTPNLTIDVNWEYLTPLFCFELGTEKTGLENTLKHAKSDIEKLSKAKKCGYLIHIFRDTTYFPSNTPNRNETQRLLFENFENTFTELYKKIPNNVKIIAILLSPFRKQVKSWGKCKIFNKEKVRWEFVGNDSAIDEKISYQLA